MAEGCGDHRGGIAGLLDLHEEYPEAFEYELISVGVRWRDLGTKRLSWRDLKVIVSQAPVNGALTRARYPDAHAQADRQIETLAYHLAVANVQRGNASRAPKSSFPELPVWARQSSTQIGSGAVPIDELAEWLGGPFLNPYS